VDKLNPMSSQTIPPSDLDRLLAVYQVYEQERQQDGKPFLKLLTWVDQKQASQKLLERICQPGEVIIQEDEPGDAFYLIRSGQAVVIKGDIQTLTILGFRSTGDAIGEMALLENLPRSATVIALTTISLWCLNRETFYQFLAENPGFSLDIMNMLSWRIRESAEEIQRGSVREKQQVEVLENLNEQATRDPLTGIFNRRQMDKILHDEIIRARKNGSTVGILMADVDHFKQINDRYGHKAGDLVLQSLARLFKNCVRAADMVCRYGGEEFVIIMPGATLSNLSKTAEEIRSRCQAMRVTYDGQEIQTTISLGAAIFPQHGSRADEVLVHADRALYCAKQQGRNRMTVYIPGPGSEKVDN
jgi:diguanylate cyclase (GGDEF)-like protein